MILAHQRGESGHKNIDHCFSIELSRRLNTSSDILFSHNVSSFSFNRNVDCVGSKDDLTSPAEVCDYDYLDAQKERDHKGKHGTGDGLITDER